MEDLNRGISCIHRMYNSRLHQDPNDHARLLAGSESVMNKSGMILFSAREVCVSVVSEYHHAEQVVTDVALLQDMAAGRLDSKQVQEAAEVLLTHRRHDLPSVSVAVAARLLGVSRTTIESWLQAGVLIPASAKRRRHEVTIDSLVRLQVLLEELRRLGKSRELRDYVWWSAQDATDYADGKLAEALRQLRAGQLGDEYVPSSEDLSWARRQLRVEEAEEDS